MNNTPVTGATAGRHLLDVSINFDQIFNRIYAESGWYGAHNPNVQVLTPDQRGMFTLKIKAAYNDLFSLIAGYIVAWNFNPNIEDHNITFTFGLKNTFDDALPTNLEQIIIDVLANYVLMSAYGDAESLYGTAWRKSKAQLIVAFARNDNGL